MILLWAFNRFNKKVYSDVCVFLFQAFIESKMGSQAYLVSVPVKVKLLHAVCTVCVIGSVLWL